MVDRVEEKEAGKAERTELERALKECEGRLEFFQGAYSTLLILIKEFSLDLSEIDADGFRESLDSAENKIMAEKKAKKLPPVLEKQKRTIFSYVERLKKYLSDRENEFKGIIDILTKAIATVDSDNQVFNEKIYEQSESIEKLTLLDDIKKIKSSLKQEVDKVKTNIKKKQQGDNQRLKVLSKQISSLNIELEKAKAESLIDGLTGVYNRLGFERLIKKLEDKNALTKSPFSLLIIDIDNFKNINDTYGHPIGDRVILALIQKCKEITRKSDYISRLGGDEFAVIMEGASLRNAIKKAKKLSQEIAGARYKASSERETYDVSFTVSVGVSALRKGDTKETVTERADKALYTAKRSGKSRVVSEKDLKWSSDFTEARPDQNAGGQ
jgi:diguanylate cyclase